jgi:hypothetical protein
VQQYAAFLERVSTGDYDVRLDTSQIARGEGMDELRILGRYLNATIEVLVRTLRDMEVMQRRYVGEVWEAYVHSGGVGRGFRYRGNGAQTEENGQVEADGEAWLPSMGRAVQDGGITATDDELALPITLSGQVIGAIGARRDESANWSGEDIALVRAVVDQLAQTIESLRLLDETQRREARERTIAEVGARIRESLDLETMLRAAASEMRQALDLGDLVIRLATPEMDTDGVE